MDAIIKIKQIYTQQLFKLVEQAYQIHKEHFSCDVELCRLINIKVGGCPEDCSYCSQSNRHTTGVTPKPLPTVTAIEEQVMNAKQQGVHRICLGAAYKTPSSTALKKICEYVQIIKKHGLEACVTLGSLSQTQATQLKNSGLDYYNHNIDTSEEYYAQVVTTHTFQDRINTIKNVGQAGIKVCSGGILGLGESVNDRISFIHALTKLPYVPHSIPINILVKIPGTPLFNAAPKFDKLELVRMIATVRILFPATRIRLTAGRTKLSELEQSICFMAGANSIFYGNTLLTTPNNNKDADKNLLKKLGINIHANLG